MNGCPLKVVLMEICGSMLSCYLPAKKEGRFLFSRFDQTETDLPIYISAVDDTWYVHCEKDASIYQQDLCLGKSAPLQGHSLYFISFQQKQYILNAEEEDEKDSAFVPYYVSSQEELTIGRSENCDIRYSNNYVSNIHASIQQTGTGWRVSDKASTNGSYLNGRHVSSATAVSGDVLYIMGLYVIFAPRFILLNNANNRVQINHPGIKPLEMGKDINYTACTPQEADAFFDRQPRRQFAYKPDEIEVSMPPVPVSSSKMPLALRMANPAVMGGRAVMSGNYSMALTSLVLPLVTQSFTDKDKKEYEEQRRIKYREYLAEKEKEILSERDAELNLFNGRYPALEDVLGFVDDKNRLWERRYTDEDFLKLRIGTGHMPLQAKIKYPRESFELETDVLKDDMLEMLHKDYSLYPAPITLSLTENYIVGIQGVAASRNRILRNIIAQLALTHSYDEVKIILLASKEDLASFDQSVRFLPHCWDDKREIRFIATNLAEACAIGTYLQKKIEKDKNNRSGKVMRPAFVVMALNKELLDCIEPLQEYIEDKEYRGISVITAFSGALKESKRLIRIRKRNGILVNLQGMEESDVLFETENCNEEALANTMRRMAGVRLKTEGKGFALPKTYTFLEMFNAGKIEYLNPLMRWRENNPIKSLATPVGVGTDGELFYLDLHQKKQGPHGLVAGTTGSGKSEFLLTYILSLAVNFSPDEVAFVLVDYKGGGLVKAFEDPERGIHLPHVVGTVTNLDVSAIQRALSSINSEMQRRQRVFNEAKTKCDEGTMDIYDYQKLYRAGRVDEPMPHLFLISDEFAELKQQKPEFLEGLISAARIGRSLGIHLILATQKPGGVVNDQIWTNSKFRVCLKVQDRGDSMEMLKRPEAAELKDTGRFYLQVGYNEFFALGQSAWTGADYVPQEAPPAQKDQAVDFLDETGQIMLSSKPVVVRGKSDQKQLMAIVRYLSDLAKQEGLKIRSIWEDPLENVIDYDELKASVKTEKGKELSVLMGMVDDPERQKQYPLELNFDKFLHLLICGAGGSGKSNFLRTMLYGLTKDYTPQDVNYYILDYSGGMLSAFKDAPHCGAYLTDAHPDAFSRLIQMLQDIVQERKALFTQADVANYNAYCRIQKIPRILLVIDNVAGLRAFQQGDIFSNVMHDHMRNMAPFGVSIILTSTHLNEVNARARQNIDLSFALEAKDRFDYTDILGVRCTTVPPVITGRGLCVQEGRPLEYHTSIYLGDSEEHIRTAHIRKEMQELSQAYQGDYRARRLPMADADQSYEDFFSEFPLGRIPLGYSRADMKKVALPFKQMTCVSLYFGQPACVKPVFSNILYTARQNDMKVIAIKRSGDSVFASYVTNHIELDDTVEVWDCNAEVFDKMDAALVEILTERNVHRDAYCEMHGIPASTPGKAVKAADYIRAHTKPVMFLIESLADFCNLQVEEGKKVGIAAICSGIKGYNTYFVGATYHDDAPISLSNAIFQAFVGPQLLMLFGGRFDKVNLTNLSLDIRKFDKPLQNINHFMLKYRDAFYPMQMPFGQIKEEEINPDDAAII